ncbi:hypothetical protein [Gordonia polyisoprenivorans]|uniref:hypothetical protein n=1 Tax=Gordonia polyisoprenivorans TaxID=84595 RepID=UPI000364EFA7|nr:hypothetical protein [Gordonia polyisoprenivorans]
MSSADDEIRFIRDGYRLLKQNVAAEVWSRGWAVTDLDVGDNEPLEWFWPPTAPVGYGGLPDWGSEFMQLRPQMFGPRHTPWLSPTRITTTAAGWRVDYGEAIAQKPDASSEFSDAATLLEELERIEWWPMTIAEVLRLRADRVLQSTVARAHGDHELGVYPTEPYSGQRDAILDHIVAEAAPERRRGTQPPGFPRQHGDLHAQLMLVDADAWVSAVRTARAGGAGWGPHGPEAADR